MIYPVTSIAFKGTTVVTSIVKNNQSLDATPFNLFNRPPLVPGTDGVALPKGEATAVLCVAPGDGTTWNDNWGQELKLSRGDPHLAIAPDDTYPNQVFVRDYVVVTAVDRTDPLAAVLWEFWSSRGYDMETLRAAWRYYLDSITKPPKWMAMVRAEVAKGQAFFFAKKTQPVVVEGVVDLRFQTSEGPTRLEHGSVLVTHPDDATNQWLLRPDPFADRYNWTRAPRSGLLIPKVD